MKDIEGYEGLYAVTEDGCVWSYPKHRSPNGRWLKKILRHNGYFGYTLSKKEKQLITTIHRLVAEAFIPNPDNLPIINHKDGIKTNNKIENLEWCTYSENNQHAYDTGLRNRLSVRKLTPEDIRYIRKNSEGLTQEALGKMFDVCLKSIWRIIHNKTYKDVEGI